MSSKYRVTKGFKFHARPKTGAYSCYTLIGNVAISAIGFKNDAKVVI